MGLVAIISNGWRGSAWPRTLPQEIDNHFAPAGVTAAGATKRFAQSPGNDIDFANDAAMLVRAAARAVAGRTSDGA